MDITPDKITELFLAQAVEVSGRAVDWWVTYLPLVRRVSLFLSIALIFLIIYVVMRLMSIGKDKVSLAEVAAMSSLNKKRVIKIWQKIEKRVATRNEADLKLAVIEADKILDEVLKVGGYTGGTMAERLERVSTAQLASINNVWRAHKMRNRLVHEPEATITISQAEELLLIYKKAFQEFGLMS